VTDLVSMEGYELEAFPSRDPDDPTPDFLLASVAAGELCFAAYVDGREGNWDGAFDSCGTVYRLARRHPASDLITHLIAFQCENTASRCAARLAAACDRPRALRVFLEEMNRLNSGINLDALKDPLMVEWVGMLRGFARRGYEVDLSSEKPLRYLFRQVVRISMEEGGGEEAEQWDRLLSVPIASRVVEELLVRMAIPNFEEARARELDAKAGYDLTRLAVASRIEKLETGRRPVDVSALVPKYIPEPLSDPFADGPYRRDPERKTFYSIGPDGTDSSAKISYDPTNGTVSAGDIFLPGRTRPQGADMIR